jgi:hypothetical protein
MIKRMYLCLAAVVAALGASAAQAASDYLIQIDGIPGTSTLAGFEDYIGVESWSLGFVRGTCQGLHFVKQMDAASAPMTGATHEQHFHQLPERRLQWQFIVADGADQRTAVGRQVRSIRAGPDGRREAGRFEHCDLSKGEVGRSSGGTCSSSSIGTDLPTRR